MKKTLLLTLPAVALFATAVSIDSKPLPTFADSEETSSVIEESSSESAAKFNYEDIEIDGKTIAQWKQELKDEQTRDTAIAAIIAGGILLAFRFVIWLADRGIIKKNSSSAEELKAQCKEAKEEFEAAKKYFEEKNQQLETMISNSEAKFEQQNKQLQFMYEENMKQGQDLIRLLLLEMQVDPRLVASDIYKKAQEYLKEADNE